MSRLSIVRALTVAAAVTASADAPATIYDLTADYQGFINQDGNTGANSYLAGNCSSNNCSASFVGEIRNYFHFNIPLLDGPLVSATLALKSLNVVMLQSSSAVYEVTSVSSLTFSSLGTGTFFSAFTFIDGFNAIGPAGLILQPAALTALAASSDILIGGRITSPTDFGAAETYPNRLCSGAVDLGDTCTPLT